MKIYISGPITGHPIERVRAMFAEAEKVITAKGFEAVNPLNISEYDADKEWERYMADDIYELLKCDAITMLPGWKASKGARIEYAIAKEIGIRIIE